MKAFSQLFVALDQTNKTNAKVALLADYFRTAADADKLCVLSLFTGKRPKHGVRSASLRAWATERADIPTWLFEETYQMVGDLAETIALILPTAVATSDTSLHAWFVGLSALHGQEEAAQKAYVVEAWTAMTPSERLVFNKLLTGGFRIGISQNLLVQALSQATDVPTDVLAHRLMGKWTVETTTFERLVLRPNPEDALSRPYPFCLAHPLEEPERDLPDLSAWQAEWKWDGMRGQIIVREQHLFVWSRGEELITDKFPEFDALRQLSFSAVLDGEILGFQDETPLPFSFLQTRIGRKTVGKKLLQTAPVVFVAYDLLEHEGRDLRNLPLAERRQQLEAVVAAVNLPVLRLSPCVAVESLAELHQARDEARTQHAEGLMLKHRDAPYENGRKRGVWWKWKVEPYTVDAVLLYAQKGHGRRAGLFTDYTFGVWHNGELVPCAKAYSGLTDREFKAVDAFVRKNTKEKFGPVRTVTPELVFEIGFEAIAPSPRHKSGVALRFPRMLRWRTDKKAEDADTLAHLLALL